MRITTPQYHVRIFERKNIFLKNETSNKNHITGQRKNSKFVKN